MQAFCPSCPSAWSSRCGYVDAVRRLTTILPAMTFTEALETTCIHRAAGLPGAHAAFVTTGLLCPYGAPHHICRSDVTQPCLPAQCIALLTAV